MNILAVIPARGGSKGIPRKNVRLLKGKPLISYSITCALNSKFDIDVVVSTDDKEIERIATLFGAEVIERPNHLATDSITLDPVIHHALIEKEKLSEKRYDVVITMQPTSPLLRTSTLDDAIEKFIGDSIDTLLSGINKPHLSWTEVEGKIIPCYEERLNRQYLPKNLLETGAFFISKREYVKSDSRFGPKVSVFEVPEEQCIDIDSAQDWWIAEKELSKKSILIRTEGYREIGLGHIYRCLLLANNLIDHDILFVISNKSDLGIRKLHESNYPYVIVEDDNEVGDLIVKYKADILINDILDTTKEYVTYCKSFGVRVVNFEDLGSGAEVADAVINDLYEKQNNNKNHYWGSDYYCIRDEFLLSQPAKYKSKAREVLVIFGGTDPCNLTQRLLDIVATIEIPDIHYTFILGMGYNKFETLQSMVEELELNVDIVRDVKLITEYMKKADIAISSQGRTMLELASMAVPTILLAQNSREQHHEFGYLKNGFINLGLGTEATDLTIRESLIWLINSPQIRSQMKEQMLKSNLKDGINRVLNIILDKNI